MKNHQYLANHHALALRATRIGAAVLLSVSSATALAQQLAQRPPDAGTVLQQQTKERLADPQQPSELLPRVEQPRPALGAPGLKLVVKQFRVSGNTIFPSQELLDQIKSFVGKEQTIDGLNDAATVLRRYYRARGYFLALAYLPRQEIRDGVVEIAVIEGRVGQVTLNQSADSRLSERLIRGIIDANLRTGEIITEESLERPLLLINDLPNAQVTSEIQPSRTVGAADLKVNLGDTRRGWNVNFEVDNSGSRFTGEHKFGATANWNNPLGLGDQLTVSGFTTNERMQFWRASYIVPVWYYGSRIGVSYSAFDYRIARDFENLKLHGFGVVSSVFGFHPIVRTRNTNVILQFAYEDKELFDLNEVDRTRTDTFVTTSKLGIVGDFRDGTFGGGLNAYTITQTEGKVNLAPFNVFSADQAAATGRKTFGRFAKTNYEMRRLQKLTDQATLLLALAGQVGSKNLAGSERFGLGGPAGVRAYPVGEAGGDSGHLFTGEFRYVVPQHKVWGGDFTVSGFYDVGWVKVNQDPFTTDTQNERNLAGYGVGLSLAKDSDFLLRTSAAWRAERERPLADGVRRIPRIWFQAIKWF